MASILVIEDEENLRFSIRQALSKAGHEVVESDSVPAAQALMRDRDFDALITDIHLGEATGIDLVRQVREDGFEGGIVVMTAYGSIESAVAAMKLGADDYLQKPLSLEELQLLVERLLETRKLRRRLNLYERLEGVRTEPQGIIGDSAAWRKTIELAGRLASVPVMPRAAGPGAPAARSLPTILLLGETGTGKGVLARYIHQRGSAPGASPPFVHVNCSALPPSLVESELFGHEKGAFTDAKAQRPGLFEMAEGGTIFLDEIGDMPLALQAKILTVVEDGTFRRVGSSRDRTVSARIIAATNQDLEKRVADGSFRRDLLYRLNALTIRLPALRERNGDAALIASELLERFAKEAGRPGLKIGASGRAAILRYDWPGNVRELINAAQRAAMLAEGPDVTAEDLGLPSPEPLPPLAPASAGVGQAAAGSTNGHAATAGAGLVFDFDHGPHRAEEVERELIVQALHRTRGNVSRAAKLIGMQRSSLRYRIDRFGLESLVQEITGQ